MELPGKTTIHGPADQTPGESHFQSQNDDATHKNNFRSKYENLTCRVCKNTPDTQQHILEECPSIHLNDEYIVKKDYVFGTEKTELRKFDTLCKPYTITKCYSLFQRWDPCDQRRAHTELNWTPLHTNSIMLLDGGGGPPTYSDHRKQSIAVVRSSWVFLCVVHVTSNLRTQRMHKQKNRLSARMDDMV